MTSLTDMPADIWTAAESALDNMLCHCRESSGSTEAYRRDSINEIARAILAERQRDQWQDIATAPKDGSAFMAATSFYEWPEVLRWEAYAPEDAEEVGEEGYWRYAEEILANVAEVDISDFTHWQSLPADPNKNA